MGYLILSTVALIGFLASLVCHVMAWLHMEPPFGQSTFMLHIGFLVLWFPFVLFANKTMPKGARGNMEHLFKELPRAVRWAVTALFVYALLNFACFAYCTSHIPKREIPLYIEIRGFSGHWMMFYGVAAAGFMALGRLARKKKESEIGPSARKSGSIQGL